MIRKKDVIIARRYIVDCVVCGEAVEPESGSFESFREAEDARERHLAEHRRGEYEQSSDLA